MNASLLVPPGRVAVAVAGIVAVLGMVLAAPATEAAGPLLEKGDLFEAKRGGYALYRVPGIGVTPPGTLLAYCEARRTGKSDWDTIDIMLRRSTDGGRTWEPRRQIAHFGPRVAKNPVALRQKLAEE